jgi:hypothetical protein
MQQFFYIILFSILCGHIKATNNAMLAGQPLTIQSPWRTVVIHRNRKLRRKKVFDGKQQIPFYERVQNILYSKGILINVQKGKTYQKSVHKKSKI